MDSLFRRRGTYWIVILISLLLMVELFVSYRNSIVIAENVKIQKEAERIKVNTLDIIRTLHLLDLGIRGYAILPNDQIGASYDTSLVRKEVVLRDLEKSLQAQKFEMLHFYKIKDSVDSYFGTAKKMMDYLKSGERKKFEIIFSKDLGYNVWVDYKAFSARIDAFENSISEKSRVKYEDALRLNYMLLTFLLFLIIPTLFYTAYQTTRTFTALDRLKQSEIDKNRILATQNETLDRLVKERTEEIEAQNEEIVQQNEEISTRNEALSAQRDEIAGQHEKLNIQNLELKAAQKLIEDQNKIIEQSNIILKQEVKHQTESLIKTNKELAQNISQLEQFTFIVSHNLRAPVARILGLGTVLDQAKDNEEEKQIIGHIVKTSQELDRILNDLNLTIQVKAMLNQRLQPIDLRATLQKIENTLKPELEKNNGRLVCDDLTHHHLNSIEAYIESILFNLISNGIKYRDPGRHPVIQVISKLDGEYLQVEVRDNGMGIDLEKHGSSIFNLYKRFHFHMEGKGLGLYLVKTQVILLGGEIDVQSKVNEGTRFTIRIKHNSLS